MDYSKYQAYVFLKTILSVFVVFFGISPCFSQQNLIQRDTLTTNRDTVIIYDIFDRLSSGVSGSGKVVLGGDNIKSIVYDNKAVKKNMKGYRIRIFRDNSQTARQKAENIKANLERDYPGFPVYVTHYSPDFHVEFGDFRNHDEAEKMKRILSVSYLAATLVNVTINFPPL